MGRIGLVIGLIAGFVLAFLLTSPVPAGAQAVARYNLAAPERQIAVSWLFEPVGYLDVAKNNQIDDQHPQGLSARQALAANPTLDVTVWIRTNTKGPFTDQRDWDGTGMVWWIWKNDNVNVTPANRPPEAAFWAGILQEWTASIDRAFLRVSDVARNANTVPMTAEDGSQSTMPAGTNLIHQRSLFQKVLGVLV